jgi:hypothetical protein
MQLGLLDQKALAGRHSPCPVCQGRDRFHFSDRDVGLWHCRNCDTGGDGFKLIEHIKGVDFPRAARLVEGIVGRSDFAGKPKSQPAPPQSTGKTTAADALRLWGEGLDSRGTLAETYLRSRSLDLPADLANEVLRWHPRIGAMLALFRNIATNAPQAVSRTYLTTRGEKIERRFLGPVGGAAIKFDADDTVLGGLHIGEGVETCMSARQPGTQPAPMRPTWALGDANGIEKLPVLDGIESLTFLIENGCAANAKAIEVCGTRWRNAGREVRKAIPAFGKDMNDAIKNKAAHPPRKAASFEHQHLGDDPRVEVQS